MPRVLIIDHDALLTRLYEKRFAREGYEVGVAATGREGLSLCYRQPPDAVVLDLATPDGGGLELVRLLRDKPPSGARSLPLVVFSNAFAEGEAATAESAGADVVLSKDRHGPRQLVETVADLLARGGHSTAMLAIDVTQMNERQQLQDMFRTQGTAWTDEARTLHRGIDPDRPEAAALERLAHLAHYLLGGARIASMPGLAVLAMAIESLLHDLIEAPARYSLSTHETIGDALGCIERLLIGTGETINPAKARVLVVDDEPASVSAIHHALKRIGVRGAVTGSPDKALGVLAEDIYDILIVNAGGSGMDGLELARRARALPTTARMPIILMSDRTAFDSGFRAVDGPAADDVVVRPFPAMELGTKLITHLLAANYFGSGGFVARSG